MANLKPVNLGIIGFGGMAHHHLNRIAETNGLFNPVGVYDIDQKMQQDAVNRGLKAYGSAEELLNDKSVEAMLIATPNDFHKPYVIEAANAGKHVICEKPVTMTCSDYDDMVAAAENNKIVFEVHQNRRWDRDYIAMQKIIESGDLGKIYRIDSFVCGANGIPGGWRKIKRQGGGMMLDWGVHLIDQIFGYVKQQPLSLYCKYSKALGFDVDDGFDAQFTFEGDLTVNVRVDTNTFVKMPRWIIYGRDGTAVIRDWDLSGEIILPVYGSEVEIVGIEAGNGFTRTMAYRPHDSVVKKDIPLPNVDYFTFYKNFVAAVRGKEAPCITYKSVRKVLRLMELCNISDETNSVIKDELKEL